MPSSEKSSSMPSVFIKALYCLIRLAFVSVRIFTKSDFVKAFSSTRIGKRPCSSGKRSDGFATWNAPEAIKRTWSVLTCPYLVATVVPSIRGNRSLCTPSRLTSPPERSARVQILSISSRNTMPSFSTVVIASWAITSSSTSLSHSSAISAS